MSLPKQIELELEREALKVENRLNALEELKSKLNRLEIQIKNLETGIQNSETRIKELGTKMPRRDGKPETPESLETKKSYNEELLRMKIRFLKDHFDKKNPEFWPKLEQLLPDALKDIGISDN